MRKCLLVSMLLLISVCFFGIYAPAEEITALSGSPDIIPSATKGMQSPDFWTARLDDPDRVIMTPAQIAELNRWMESRPLAVEDISGDVKDLSSFDRPAYEGLHFFRADPLKIPSISGDSLRAGIQSGLNFLEKRTLYDRRHIEFPALIKAEIIESMDIDAIPASVSPRYGIVCHHTMNRRVPTSLTAFTEQYGWLDNFQVGAYDTGTPVAVLHATKNGDWLYVRAPFSYRWIAAGDVAFGQPDAIRMFSEPDDFIVALGHKVPVYGDSGCSAWLTDIYQGARLRLLSTGPDGYEVLVPYRGENGMLRAVNGWVKADADVHVGYQPFTQRNVIDTAFKILYHPYGWGDSDNERDCCGLVRTVFDTFGIFTARAPRYQFYASPHVTVFPKETPKEEKYRLFEKSEPGISICGFNGHIMIYLGKVGDNHYVVHSNGYSYHDKDGNEIRMARTSVTDLETEGGSDINNFTEIATFKP